MPGKPNDPQSCFPTIGKTYGLPVGHWLQIARTAPFAKHMEVVNRLKSEHGPGHGHAKAIGAFVRAQGQGRATRRTEHQMHWRPCRDLIDAGPGAPRLAAGRTDHADRLMPLRRRDLDL